MEVQRWWGMKNTKKWKLSVWLRYFAFWDLHSDVTGMLPGSKYKLFRQPMDRHSSWTHFNFKMNKTSRTCNDHTHTCYMIIQCHQCTPFNNKILKSYSNRNLKKHSFGTHIICSIKIWCMMLIWTWTVFHYSASSANVHYQRHK